MKGFVARKKGFIVCVLLLAVAFPYLYVQNNWIKVEYYNLAAEGVPKGFNGYRIVQVSDVHLPKNASSVAKLVSLVGEQNPDLIVMTGDIIDASADLARCGLEELCKGLSEICDTYAVTGNHEFGSGKVEQWREMVTNGGVTVLDDAFVTLERNQDEISLYGLSDVTPYSPSVFGEVEEDSFCLLLAHRPELFDVYHTGGDVFYPNLVLSGHAHGGQFRIPFVGGLVAPGQGFLPRYTSGVYQSEGGGAMVVSRGLGNSIIPFRFNNRPHLPVVILRS